MNPKKLLSFGLFLSVCILPMHSFAGELDEIVARQSGIFYGTAFPSTNMLTLENLNSTQGEAKTPMRYRISLSDPSQFLIERLRTADRGETWTVFEKQYYPRL